MIPAYKVAHMDKFGFEFEDDAYDNDSEVYWFDGNDEVSSEEEYSSLQQSGSPQAYDVSLDAVMGRINDAKGPAVQEKHIPVVAEELNNTSVVLKEINDAVVPTTMEVENIAAATEVENIAAVIAKPTDDIPYPVVAEELKYNPVIMEQIDDISLSVVMEGMKDLKISEDEQQPFSSTPPMWDPVTSFNFVKK